MNNISSTKLLSLIGLLFIVNKYLIQRCIEHGGLSFTIASIFFKISLVIALVSCVVLFLEELKHFFQGGLKKAITNPQEHIMFSLIIACSKAYGLGYFLLDTF